MQFGGRDPGHVQFDAVVNAGGLGAQDLARHIEGYPAEKVPRLVLGKGNYFGFAGRPVFSRLIYPTPIDGGLGVHVTLDLAGRMQFGPDVEWIAEENYAVDPRRAESFYARIRTYWPGLPDGSLVPDYAGIRPKLSGPGEGPGRLSDRRPRRPRAAAAGQSVRHRIAGADVVAVARRSGGERLGLTGAQAPRASACILRGDYE